MFSRYSITAKPDEVAKRFSVDVPEGYRPHYNAAPTHLLPIITQESQAGLSFFYWGAPPSWANKKPLGEKIITPRVELIPEKLVLRKKMRDKRCIIPADGFYQWKRTGKRTNIPYRFTLKDKSLFALAGLWEEYEDEKADRYHTFTILSRNLTGQVAEMGDLIPVILSAESDKLWLNSNNEEELLSVLQIPLPSLDYYSVSSLVNSVDRDDRTIILPAPPTDQFGNLTLFD